MNEEVQMSRARVAGEEEIIDINMDDDFAPDSANHFAVIRQGDQFAVLGLARLKHPISREQAVNLAAWLVALADPHCILFDWILEDLV
jgi:hypothetical protein